jgi:hypothetical protein
MTNLFRNHPCFGTTRVSDDAVSRRQQATPSSTPTTSSILFQNSSSVYQNHRQKPVFSIAPLYSEEDMQNALKLVKDGLSIRKSAAENGIPYPTLRKRVKSSTTRREAFAPYQRISQGQEEALSTWICTQATLGFPMTHQEIKKLAQRLSDIRGNTSRVGKRWVSRFLARNACIATQRAKRVDAVRLNNATKETIESFFKRLQDPIIKSIKPRHRYNKDEMGLIEGQGQNGLVMGCAEYKAVVRKQPKSRTWTSFIECISARGRALPSLVIFKGKSVQTQWFPRKMKPFEG